MAGLALGAGELERLDTYRNWLLNEAVPAGGLGPSEPSRVDTRHIADSLLFAVAMPEIPRQVWDLGSGVGLPGIPLAIILAETRFVLVERAGRRVDLLERALRILELDNVEVAHRDIADLTEPADALVSRASLGPQAICSVASRLLRPGGFAVMGGSWNERPDHEGWQTLQIRPGSLDQPVWLLIMPRQ